MIKLTAIGNLGRDAETKQVNGRNVINFSVAHTEKYKNREGVQVDKTIWLECDYWTDRPAIGQYLKKGTQVYIEGQPEVRTYTAKDGTTKSSLSVRISSVQLLGSRNSEGVGGGGTSSGYQPAPQISGNTATPTASDITEPFDDLPF